MGIPRPLGLTESKMMKMLVGYPETIRPSLEPVSPGTTTTCPKHRGIHNPRYGDVHSDIF